MKKVGTSEWGSTKYHITVENDSTEEPKYYMILNLIKQVYGPNSSMSLGTTAGKEGYNLTVKII